MCDQNQRRTAKCLPKNKIITAACVVYSYTGVCPTSKILLEVIIYIVEVRIDPNPSKQSAGQEDGGLDYPLSRIPSQFICCVTRSLANHHHAEQKAFAQLHDVSHQRAIIVFQRAQSKQDSLFFAQNNTGRLSSWREPLLVQTQRYVSKHHNESNRRQREKWPPRAPMFGATFIQVQTER